MFYSTLLSAFLFLLTHPPQKKNRALYLSRRFILKLYPPEVNFLMVPIPLIEFGMRAGIICIDMI